MLKQAIVVRKDLDLGKGKIAAQVAHASLGAYRKADGRVKSDWEHSGEKKVVLKVDDEKTLLDIYEKAIDSRLPCALIHDAGRTQIPEGTATALGIGPADEKKIDAITKNLKLL